MHTFQVSQRKKQFISFVVVCSLVILIDLHARRLCGMPSHDGQQQRSTRSNLDPTATSTSIRSGQMTAGDTSENRLDEGRFPTDNDIPDSASAELRSQLTKTFSTDPKSRGAALRVLATMPNDAATIMPFVIRMLGDEATLRTERYAEMVNVVKVRDEAFVTLCSFGKSAVAPCLNVIKYHLKSPEGQACLGVLGQIKDNRAIPNMLALLNDGDRTTRCAVMDSIITWNDSAFVSPLIRVLKDHDSEVRLSAIFALGIHAESDVTDALLDALSTSDKRERIAIIQALGGRNDARAVGVILSMLIDPKEDEGVRWKCGLELGGSSDPLVLEELFRVCSDSDVPNKVRSGAALGLAQCKAPTYAERLAKLSLQENNGVLVRRDLIYAVARLDQSNAVKLLSPIVQSASVDIRVKCFAAMQIIEISDGHVDSEEYASVLARGYMPLQPANYYPRDRLMRKIARNGNSEAVRTAARAKLQSWDVKESPSMSDSLIEK